MSHEYSAEVSVTFGVILSGLTPDLSLPHVTSEESPSGGVETLRWHLAATHHTGPTRGS
jgi:hypothetical protein